MTIEMSRLPPCGLVTETLIDRRSGRSWDVPVERFDLGVTVVTAELWAQVWGESSHFAGDVRPKVDVSWRDAIRFCNRLSRSEGLEPAYVVTTQPAPFPESSWTPHDQPAPDDWHVVWNRQADGYRLPTDAEWQLACRAGTSGPRYGELDDIGWYDANSGGELRPVAQKTPNAWGLHDMLGGVWEWCWDLYDESVYGSYRIIRGGGWSDPHYSCRAGVRRTTNPRATFDDLGFRLAKSLS